MIRNQIIHPFSQKPNEAPHLLLFLTCWLQHCHASLLLDTERIRSQLFEGAKNKKTGVTTNAPQRQTVSGIVSRVADSESIWLRIDDRGEFRNGLINSRKAAST